MHDPEVIIELWFCPEPRGSAKSVLSGWETDDFV